MDEFPEWRSIGLSGGHEWVMGLELYIWRGVRLLRHERIHSREIPDE